MLVADGTLATLTFGPRVNRFVVYIPCGPSCSASLLSMRVFMLRTCVCTDFYWVNMSATTFYMSELYVESETSFSSCWEVSDAFFDRVLARDSCILSTTVNPFFYFVFSGCRLFYRDLKYWIYFIVANLLLSVQFGKNPKASTLIWKSVFICMWYHWWCSRLSSVTSIAAKCMECPYVSCWNQKACYAPKLMLLWAMKVYRLKSFTLRNE